VKDHEKKLIAGNWKMNGSLAANEALVKALRAGLQGAQPLRRGRVRAGALPGAGAGAAAANSAWIWVPRTCRT
jgi:hypothetical protein